MENKDLCELCGQSKATGECICDLDLGDGVTFTPEEHVVSDKVEQVDTSDLTEDEKALLKKIQDKQATVDPIMEGFANLPGKPSDEQIEAWKKQFGKIFTIGLNEDEFYLFRPLRRLEWRNLMTALAKQQDEMKKKEAIVQRAVVWPKLTPEKIGGLTAGAPDTLYEMILQCSNFLLPQEAMACVRKL